MLKKYAGVEDLNLSEAEIKGFPSDKKKGGRERESEGQFTVFSVNVGRQDDFSPRDLMAIINKYAPQKGLEIGGIRIFDNVTKFEVDVTGIEGFGNYFRNVNFNGLPFMVRETGERPGSLRKGGERSGKRNSTANNKWKGERRRSEGSSRGRFGEKKKGVDNGRRSGKKH